MKRLNIDGVKQRLAGLEEQITGVPITATEATGKGVPRVTTKTFQDGPDAVVQSLRFGKPYSEVRLRDFNIADLP